jgi:hypothetical protein
LARLSGAARRKLQAGKALAAGVHRSHYLTSEVRSVREAEIAAKRAQIATQREHARLKNWAFVAQSAAPLAHTPIQTRRP